MSAIFVLYKTTNHYTEQMDSVDFTIGLDREALVKKVKALELSLDSCNRNNEFCKSDLARATQEKVTVDRRASSGPTRNYNNSDDYQQIGIVYNSTGRFPLYGRRKYPGNSSKWEYYTIDETRNRLQIEVKSTNYNELYTGDTISIPILGGTFTVTLYEYNNFRYTG
jgi:hypothetical protein